MARAAVCLHKESRMLYNPKSDVLQRLHKVLSAFSLQHLDYLAFRSSGLIAVSLVPLSCACNTSKLLLPPLWGSLPMASWSGGAYEQANQHKQHKQHNQHNQQRLTFIDLQIAVLFNLSGDDGSINPTKFWGISMINFNKLMALWFLFEALRYYLTQRDTMISHNPVREF